MNRINAGERLPVICRPARPEDTPDMLELTRTIWDGHDYVPHVWERWLADPAGRLAAAEHQGRVLGLSKLTHLGGNDWWLEGLRVHPEYQGRGVASQLHDYLVGHWQEIGGGVLRMATASTRLAVHRLCARSGFERVAEVSSFAAPPLPAGAEAEFQPLGEDECQEAADFARRSPVIDWQGGLMEDGWRWAPPAAATFGAPAREGRAWWWRGRQGLIVQHLDADDERPELGDFLVLQVAACQPELLPDLLSAWRGLAGSQGRLLASWMAGLHPELLTLLEKAGFQRDWDESLYIFALPYGEISSAKTSENRKSVV